MITMRSGVGVTALILTAGMFSMFSGNKKLSQNLMRARIAAQGVTSTTSFPEKCLTKLVGVTVVSIQYATLRKQKQTTTEE